MTGVDCFVTDAAVYFDDLDLNGHLHNARLVTLVERAQTALFERLGGAWQTAQERPEDLRYVVRELHVEFLAPVSAPGPLAVALQVLDLGRTSARYGFRCERAGVVVARGHRGIVKIGTDGRPAPWTEWYRGAVAALSRGQLPAGSP